MKTANKNDLELINEIHAIRKSNHNFSSIKKIIGRKRLKKFLNMVYPKFTITEIETIMGIPDSTLARWFQELDIPFVRHHIKSIALPGEKNMELIIQKDDLVFKSVTIRITPDLAYVIGFALGDGAVQQYMLEVFNKDKALRDILYNYLTPYGTITTEERTNGLWRLRLSNGVIANLTKDKNGIRKDTLDYIFSRDILVKQFIAAFWDAEGSVLYQQNKDYYNLYLYNSNRDIMDRVCTFLRSKNIIFSIHERNTRDKEYLLKGRLVKSKKRLIRINIHKSSWVSWINEIGIHMNHTKKRLMIKEILNRYGGNQNG